MRCFLDIAYVENSSHESRPERTPARESRRASLLAPRLRLLPQEARAPRRPPRPVAVALLDKSEYYRGCAPRALVARAKRCLDCRRALQPICNLPCRTMGGK